jgi:hypothetical protein
VLGQGDDIHVAFDDNGRVLVAQGGARLRQTENFAALSKSGVSGELRYLGSPSPMTRPPKAMTSPFWFMIGNITRSRKRS